MVEDIVPRLILLNGPPGIGKSTLAQRYADDHPGVLNLDIDRVRLLIGGWRDRFGETGEIVRPVAAAMAATHLKGGRDVVLPQYLGRLGEIERFEAVAHQAGARFREIVLLDSKDHALDRFERRGGDGEHGEHGTADAAPWHRQVREIVARSGGPTLLAGMYDRLLAVLESRPAATVVPSEEGRPEQAYRALLDALRVSAGSGGSAPSGP